MKHIKILSLAIVILICSLMPVISAEVDVTENNTHDLNVNNTDDLNVDNTNDLNYTTQLGKKYPNFKMFFVDHPDATYSPDEDIYFEIMYNVDFKGPIKVYVDKEYITTINADYVGNVIMGFCNYHFSPGKHLIECEFDGNDDFYYAFVSGNFYIK